MTLKALECIKCLARRQAP